MKKQVKVGENTTITYGWKRCASKKAKQKKPSLMTRMKAYLKRNVQFVYIKEYDDEVK
ncbi:hypothetical protein [Eubacterium sp. 1001713B170207_170306_E7]|uniref:hypothetical protein n=1 Tax=Eubacterium sp. 1001713B170207_170306_E7 TaxID=2787097 RepID=UPI00189AFF75|nr:hypothetical protein [Eubacterium sp. 1001713B170207_170306_E7]